MGSVLLVGDCSVIVFGGLFVGWGIYYCVIDVVNLDLVVGWLLFYLVGDFVGGWCLVLFVGWYVYRCNVCYWNV